MDNLEWRPVVGSDGRLEVSEYGDIRRIVGRGNGNANRFPAGSLVKGQTDRFGYNRVNIGMKPDGKRMFRSRHRIVADAFLGECPEGMEVNHKDGNKLNNHYSNLEYITHRENVMHSFHELDRMKTVARGSSTGMAKLIESDKREIISLYEYGWSQREIAKAYQVSHVSIGNILRGKTWSEVE